MSDNISPEERLFNAIENTKGAPASTAPKKLFFDFKSVFFRFKKWILSIGAKRREDFSPKRAAGVLQLGRLQGGVVHNLKLVNKALGGLAVILAALLITDIITPTHSIEKLYASASALGNWQFQKELITPLKPFSYYEEAVNTRDLFNPVPKTSADGLIVPGDLRLQEAVKDLSLVGIYWGKRPEVMIEDKTAKKTYFLKQGDEIKGIKIKEILKDRVTLEYLSEKAELL